MRILAWVSWLVIALLMSAVTMKGLPSPPLEGAELYTAYLTFYGVVLGGPISHFFTNYHLFHEWIYWIPFAGGSIAFLPLLITRFHSTGAIILSGVLWTGAGAVSLFYQICLAI